MGDTCSSARFSKDFHVPQLKERNSYGYSDDTPDDKVVMSVFSQSYDENRKSRIISMIQSSRSHLFQDDKFKITETQAQRLSVLFNFEASRTRIFSKKEDTDLTSFIQMNVEMSYLAAVFYLLCRKEAKNNLLPRLVQNQETNNYGAYSTSLFCNGQTHQVIVDDRMPTHNDDFLYLRIVKGIELWPLILEKAWCKQIGSYERAKGLSTEDAFEEITGIPAYTYNLQANNRSSIKTMVSAAMSKGYWIALIARSGLSDLINQQVFYLQSINGNEYTIISPYVSYNFDNYAKNHRGEVKVRQQDIFSHFQQIVIGYYKPNHMNLTVPVVSKSREELVFQINVANQEEVSIRFNQLYQGYLANSDRPHYQYSPLMMELYQIKETNGMRKKCRIVDNCQGCTRSIMGTRSSKCSGGILQTLQGKYLLRLQVGWNYEGIINKGNLVIYSSQNNVQISQLKNTELLFKEIYPILFQNEGKKYILHEHSLEVITFDKQKTTLIMFHNVVNTPHHFQVDFTTSINVRLRGREVKGRRAVIRLQADQKELIQVMPQDLREIMEIKNFEIIKLAIK